MSTHGFGVMKSKAGRLPRFKSSVWMLFHTILRVSELFTLGRRSPQNVEELVSSSWNFPAAEWGILELNSPTLTGSLPGVESIMLGINPASLGMPPSFPLPRIQHDSNEERAEELLRPVFFKLGKL